MVYIPKFIISFILLIVFRVLLDISYVNFVYPVFNTFPLDISFIKIFESYVLLIILFVFLNAWFSKIEKPSYVAIYIIFINLIVPMLSFYGFTNGNRGFIYATCISIFIVMFIVRFQKTIILPYFKQGKAIAWLVIIMITFFVFAYLIGTGGISRLNFNLGNVYETRDLYGKSKNFIMGYLLPWQAYAIDIFILSYALYKRKIKLVILTIIGQTLLFGMTGFKSYLFAPLLILALYYFLSIKKYQRLFPVLTFGSILLLAYGLYSYFANGDTLISSIVIRRLFFVPAQLHFIYYDFFQNSPFMYLSNSIFSFFVKNPYEGSNILHVISNDYFDKDMGINVGYIGNAYMNFGYFGVLMFSILLGYFLKLVDSMSTKIPIFISTSVIVIPSMSLVDSALLTVLLTGGFLFSALLLWLANAEFKEN